MTGHRYWRINATATLYGDGYAAIAAIEFRSSIGGSNIITGGTASADSFFTSDPTYAPSKAVDGNNSTYWMSNATVPSAWWAYDFGVGVAVDVVEVKITSRPDGFSQRAPSAGSVQYSDSGSTWTTAFSYSGLSYGSAGATQTFPEYGERVRRQQAYVAVFSPGEKVRRQQTYVVVFPDAAATWAPQIIRHVRA